MFSGRLFRRTSISAFRKVDDKLPPKLQPNEWKSGEIPWLIMGLGNRRALGGLLERLQETSLKDRPLKLIASDQQGKSRLVTLTPKASVVS